MASALEKDERARFDAAGQGHVFTFWNDLDASGKEELLANLSNIDVVRANRIFTKATSVKPAVNAAASGIEALPDAAFDSTIPAANAAKIDQWREIGLNLIAENKVAVILLAGGQGTRLGSSAPKGCYDIGLPSKKSLFQLQAERLLKLEQLAASKKSGNISIPWYIMTSRPTRKETEKYFADNGYFGVRKENIYFFEQGVLPAFTNEGKIYMENKTTPSVAPDGNGGIYTSLRGQGVLKDLDQRGIEIVHAYCVDNCLVRVADPVFIGYCHQKKADCGAKAVPKSAPEEQVGVICLKDGKPAVVEYSELSEELSKKQKPDGTLYLNAGNIANHYYTVDFLKRIESLEDQLEFHIARKKIKHIDLTTSEFIAPKANNGMKLELFIFDVFPFTERMAVLEVARKDEFSPLKNAPGTATDSPETSRHDILSQGIRFLEAAGATVNSHTSGSSLELELSPLVTYAGEGLEDAKGKTYTSPLIIKSKGDLTAA